MHFTLTGTGINIMISIRNNLGLDNGNETDGLTDRGILRELFSRLANGKVGREAVLGVDLQYCAVIGYSKRKDDIE